MGVRYNSYVVLGISLNDGFFQKVWESEEEFDEYDKKGNKTGNKLKEKHLMALDHNNNTIKLGDYDIYDFPRFNNFLFDIEEKISKNKRKLLEIKCSNYESALLKDYVIGMVVSECEEEYGCEKFGVSAEDIQRVKMELSKFFNYNGPVYYYLIQNVG